MPERKTVTITALWLRRIGDEVHVLVEIDGQWRKAIIEHVDGPFSWIAEANGADDWAPDDVVAGRGEEADG